jgi:hypothetical protein
VIGFSVRGIVGAPGAQDADRFRLRFGPYRTPRFRYGKMAWCEVRGDVRIVGLSDAPIPWPIGQKGRARSLVVFGDLAKAVRREAGIAVAHHWGVTGQTVKKWRKVLDVGPLTEGTHQLRSEYGLDRARAARGPRRRVREGPRPGVLREDRGGPPWQAPAPARHRGDAPGAARQAARRGDPAEDEGVALGGAGREETPTAGAQHAPGAGSAGTTGKGRRIAPPALVRFGTVPDGQRPTRNADAGRAPARLPGRSNQRITWWTRRSWWPPSCPYRRSP